jgi:hydrogenase nickel incorporation protein HypA/HybF
MHELSIATNIVEICLEEARKADAGNVTGVVVEVGAMSGVIPEALEFSWDVANKGTPVEGASLKITEIKARARCVHCGQEFGLEDAFEPCPACNKFGNDILTGHELKIKAITIE